MQVVFLFVSLGYTEEQVGMAKKKGVEVLKLPYTALNAPPKPDEKGHVDEEELDHYNRLKDSFVVLDGTKGKTVAELQRRAQLALNPPKPRGQGANNTQNEDPGAALTQTVKANIAFMHAILDEKGESDIALRKEQRLQLWELHSLLSNLFDEDPLSDEEQAEVNKTGTK
jgi:hypothetical protein